MKSLLSFSTAILVASSLVSCNSTIDQANSASVSTASIGNAGVAGPPSAANLANSVSDVAGLASNINSVRRLVSDDDDGGSDLNSYLGAAQLGSGLLGGLLKGPKTPKTPGVPGIGGLGGSVPGVPGAPSIPSAPGIPGVKAPGVPGLPKLPSLSGLFGNAVPTPIVVEAGMTQSDLIAAAGRPSYKYTLNRQETWVYENTSFISKKIKQTAINMVPGVGPAASLMGSFKGKPAIARAAVSFDQNGIVKYFTQCDAPAATCASVSK